MILELFKRITGVGTSEEMLYRRKLVELQQKDASWERTNFGGRDLTDKN